MKVRIDKSILQNKNHPDYLVESAKFAYNISPATFAKLAEAQGILIENIQDAVNLAENVKSGLSTFNFGRMYRGWKGVTGKQIAKSGEKQEVR